MNNNEVRALNNKAPGLGNALRFMSASGLYMGPAAGKGTAWFVDTATTSPGNGRSWAHPFTTVAAAVAAAVSGDTIYVAGAPLEAITLGSTSCKGGSTAAGLRIIGAGTMPSETIWAQAANDTDLITITVANVLIANFRFRPPVYAAGNPSAIYLSAGSSNVTIQGNRFQGRAGSQFGIKCGLTSGSSCQIIDNEFHYLNSETSSHEGCAIGHLSGTHVTDPTQWVIRGNTFQSNAHDLMLPLRDSYVMDNYFGKTGLKSGTGGRGTVTIDPSIDLYDSGLSAGYNIVQRNLLAGLYHKECYWPAAGDTWTGNMCVDRSHASQVDAGSGWSITVPA